MIVTVLTQAATALLSSRGKYLMKGVADMLGQLDTNMTREIAEEISQKVLTHPLVSGVNGQLGTVIHREELTKLLLELGAADGPQRLSDQAQSALQSALVANGICKNGTPEEIRKQVLEKLENIRSLALQLELSHPELANAARARVAFLQQANSQFLAKINLWFDPTMDRSSERFTAHARFVTFFAGLAVALVLQLDTAALVSRLSTDADLRKSLVEIAQKQEAAGAAGAPQQLANGESVIKLTDIDKQNLKDLMVNNIVGIPQGMSDWVARWHWDNCVMKSLGILLTALLLSLGAPFWYGALQNLLRLRSLLAGKDDQQRQDRQAPTAVAAQPGAPDGVVITDERGSGGGRVTGGAMHKQWIGCDAGNFRSGRGEFKPEAVILHRSGGTLADIDKRYAQGNLVQFGPLCGRLRRDCSSICGGGGYGFSCRRGGQRDLAVDQARQQSQLLCDRHRTGRRRRRSDERGPIRCAGRADCRDRRPVSIRRGCRSHRASWRDSSRAQLSGRRL